MNVLRTRVAVQDEVILNRLSIESSMGLVWLVRNNRIQLFKKKQKYKNVLLLWKVDMTLTSNPILRIMIFIFKEMNAK